MRRTAERIEIGEAARMLKVKVSDLLDASNHGRTIIGIHPPKAFVSGQNQRAYFKMSEFITFVESIERIRHKTINDPDRPAGD